MNLTLSVLIYSTNERLVEALSQLLPRKGRPAFPDEIQDEWRDIYTSIQYLMPPDELASNSHYSFLRWQETNYTAESVKRCLESLGAVVVFVHYIEDGEQPECEDGDDETYGYCVFLPTVNTKFCQA